MNTYMEYQYLKRLNVTEILPSVAPLQLTFSCVVVNKQEQVVEEKQQQIMNK